MYNNVLKQIFANFTSFFSSMPNIKGKQEHYLCRTFRWVDQILTCYTIQCDWRIIGAGAQRHFWFYFGCFRHLMFFDYFSPLNGYMRIRKSMIFVTLNYWALLYHFVYISFHRKSIEKKILTIIKKLIWYLENWE